MTVEELDQRITPEILQQRFGLPAELGSVPVPRIFQAFKGIARGDRRDFLAVSMVGIMSGAIAFEGQHHRTVKGLREGVTQATMAQHAGCRRETITACMSRLARPAAPRTARSRWLQARATRDTMLAKFELHKLGCEPCAEGCPCDQGKKLEALASRHVGDEADYAPRPHRATAAIVSRRRRFGMASLYNLVLAQREEMYAVFEAESGTECSRYFSRQQATEDAARMTAASFERGCPTVYTAGTVELEAAHVSYPAIEQIAASGMADWFDLNFKSLGFKAISRYIWDPRLRDPDDGSPLGVLPRLVMSFYEMAGLLEEFRNEKTGAVSKKGELEMLQPNVAERLGVDPSSIYRANCKLEALGLIRVVAGRHKQKTERGYRRGPMLVLYLPFRRLTEAEAVMEEQRMEEACRRVLAQEGAKAYREVLGAKLVHHDLLSEWRGKEHWLGAFWRELGRRLTAHGAADDLIARMVPPLRPRAARAASSGHQDWFDSPPRRVQ